MESKFDLGDFSSIEPISQDIQEIGKTLMVEDVIKKITKIPEMLKRKEYLKAAKEVTGMTDKEINDVKRKLDSFVPSVKAEEILKKLLRKEIILEYDVEKGRLYKYTDGYWSMLDNERTLKSIIRKELGAELEKESNINEVYMAIIDILSQTSKIDRAENDVTKINLENGVFDLVEWKIIPHLPNYYMKYKLPVLYDPRASCPTWIRSLEEWINDEATRTVLCQFVGYLLTSSTKFHIAFFLTGGGSNGKSTFLDIIQSLIGSKNISNIPLNKLSGRFETANLEGKLLNICSDLDPGYLEETGVIKQLICGETIRGEFKHGKSFDFRPFCKFMFSANELPKTRDKSHGWYRRFYIVDFPNQFSPGSPGFDPKLKEKLSQELPGILNWALQGIRQTLITKQIAPSAEMEKTMNEYKISNDSVEDFMHSCVTIKKGERTNAAVAYNEYYKFCTTNGLSSPVSRKVFSSKMRAHKIEVYSTTIDGYGCWAYKDCKVYYNSNHVI